MVTKPNIGPHAENVQNNLSFDAAYIHVTNNPAREYATTGDGTVFTAEATTAQRGDHSGERVIIFSSNNTERARAYKCCWGHSTNCNRTYIDCYTQAMNA